MIVWICPGKSGGDGGDLGIGKSGEGVDGGIKGGDGGERSGGKRGLGLGGTCGGLIGGMGGVRGGRGGSGERRWGSRPASQIATLVGTATKTPNKPQHVQRLPHEMRV